MSKIKLCCFTVNYTHAFIISNNFISNELSNFKTIYINEKMDKNKIKEFINSFPKNNYFYGYLNEDLINDYNKENFAFVVIGKSKFINKINKYLNFNEFNGYIINCYDIFDNLLNINDVIFSHDYYLNTSGVIKREKFKVI